MLISKVVVGGRQQEALYLDFILFGTRQQGVSAREHHSPQDYRYAQLTRVKWYEIFVQGFLPTTFNYHVTQLYPPWLWSQIIEQLNDIFQLHINFYIQSTFKYQIRISFIDIHLIPYTEQPIVIPWGSRSNIICQSLIKVLIRMYSTSRFPLFRQPSVHNFIKYRLDQLFSS